MTDTAAATPGPLEVEGIDDLVIIGPVGPDERGVVARIEWTSMDQELAEDYARLFKAAPAMLAALEAVSGWMSMLHFIGDLTDVGEGHRAAVNAAIAQARGGEKVQG